MEKYKTLIGSLLIELALGSVYAWSLFNLPLAGKFHDEVSSVSFTFGLLTLFLAIGSSIAGSLKNRIGLRAVVALSAICCTIGLILASFASNVWVLYFSAGILLGFGDGIGYLLVITNCVRFFPNRKGLVSALCVGAYGLGSLLFKSIDSFAMQSYGLENALLIWGAITFVIVFASSFIVFDSINAVSGSNGVALSSREYNLGQAMRTTPYWLLAFMFLIDCMVGLYIIGVASNLGVELLQMTMADAAYAVSVVAVFNIGGRLIMGSLSDKLNRVFLVTFDQCLSLIALAILLFAPLNPTLLFAALALVAFAFGGTITIYPPLVSEFYGFKNLAKNYGVIYLGFGFGSLFGYIAGIFGSYHNTFVMMAILDIIAIVASIIVRLPKANNASDSEKNLNLQNAS